MSSVLHNKKYYVGVSKYNYRSKKNMNVISVTSNQG